MSCGSFWLGLLSANNRDCISPFLSRPKGLNHEESQQKMRVLTLMQMAESMREIPFTTIEKELEIPAKEVEAFIIDSMW